MTSPFLAYGMLYRVVAFVALLVWLLIEMFDSRSVIWKPSSYILILYFYILYTFPVGYLEDGIASVTRNVQFYFMLFFLIVYESYRRKSLLMLKPIVAINIVFFAVWTLTTYKGLLVDGHAARYIIRSGAEAIALTKQGIGGFTFVYSLLIYIISLMALIRHRIYHKKFLTPVSVFLLFSLVLSMMVVLKAEYSTAVILMVLSSTLFIFYSDSISKNIILFLSLILVYIAMEYYFIDILTMLQPYAEGTNYSHKISDTIATLQSGETTGTAKDRIDRYVRSFNLFLEYPFTGTWSIMPVGKHSLLLDTFAQYGLFVGIALIYMLFKPLVDIYKTHKRNRGFALTMLFLAVALVSLNNVAMAYGFMLYVFYPYVIERVENA
ncbi:hypothetical protein MNB_SV-4-98 [hydrothermal vent metagenome]|uniref:Uncharacterized protein n=1 Tax=hydrothermal vent metagenome TaxID=652676 RepID=A0A1W1E7Q5_9ZZZZ